jgi:hypothetical protein
MITRENETITGERVIMSGTRFINCQFYRCVIEFPPGGLEHYFEGGEMLGGNMVNCHFISAGRYYTAVDFIRKYCDIHDVGYTEMMVH